MGSLKQIENKARECHPWDMGGTLRARSHRTDIALRHTPEEFYRSGILQIAVLRLGLKRELAQGY